MALRPRSIDRGRNDVLAHQLLTKLVGQRKTLWGVPLVYTPAANNVPAKWMVDLPGIWSLPIQTFTTAREAVIAFLETRSRLHGKWLLRRTNAGWCFGNGPQKTFFIERPSRRELAQVIRTFRCYDSTPSNVRPNTLGWRTWTWDRKAKCLKSPAQGVLWHGPELIAEDWDQASVVRGTSGIHACRLPRGDWKLADRPRDMPVGLVVGLVERYGRYALGEVGWRAEWVIVRELLAPNEAVANTLRKYYPEVKVHIAHPHHWLTKEIL